MAKMSKGEPEVMLTQGFQAYDFLTISCAFAHAMFSR